MTYQDRDRFMWILSEKGILKYDGSEFKSFTVADGLPLNDIWYIKEDRAGRKWVGGFFDGLFYIQDDVVTEVPCGAAVNSLVFTSETADTLFFTSLDERKSYYMLREMKKLEDVKLASDENLKIRLEDKTIVHKIIPSDNCIVYFHKDGTQFSCPHQIAFNEAILKFNKQYVPVGYGNAKWIIRHGSGYKLIEPKKFFGPSFITQSTLQPSGQMIIHLENEIRVYTDLSKGVRDYEMEHRLRRFSASQFPWATLDDENNLWLSLDRNNIVLIPKGVEYIDQYRFNTDRKVNYINPILHKDELLLHEPNGDLLSFNLRNNSLTTVFSKDGQRTHGILDLRKTDDGYYFLSERFIFFQSNSGSLIKYPFISEGKETHRQFIPIGNNEFITNNLSVFELRNGAAYSKTSTNKRLRTNCMAQSANDWILATPQELIFSDKKTKNTTTVNISGIQCIYPIGDFVALGTNGYGIMIVDRSGKVHSQLHEGKSINKIILYKDFIISASNKGISIDRLDEDYHLYSHSEIGIEHGLSSNNVNGLVLRNDELIATHYSGFDLIDLPKTFKRKPLVPTIIFDSLTINNERYSGNSTDFEWDENSFVFHFSGISFWNLGNIKYKYRLVGGEEEWIYTNESSIRFPNLAPGNYTFEVVAIAPTNIESQPAIYEFSIGRHFTQTWWFSGLILLLVTSGIGILVYQIFRRKTRKLEIEKQMAHLEMSALQSQMNPHFVFNSLNSIQSVLFLKGERETNRYIGEFSKLVRQTLDNSKKGMISIQEEVDYLTTYLNLESYRLDGELQYSIELDDTLEPDDTILPCMIVQPMVENAILHGLTPKKSDRKISIRFIKFENQLKIEVEDNGIGRKKAERDLSRKEHKSWGSTILQERLVVLEKLDYSRITYDIIDLMDGENPSGTLIQIQLPISYVD